MSFECISVEISEELNSDANISPKCKQLFFNTKRYVALGNIILGSRKVEEIEENGFENCIFTYRRDDFELKCKILSKQIKKVKPGLIPEIIKKDLKRDTHSDYDLIQNASAKIISTRSSKTTNSSVKITPQQSDEVIIKASTSIISSESSNRTINKSNENTQQRNDSASGSFRETNADDDDNMLSPELNLNELLTLADNDDFPKKEFIINRRKKLYCQMLHFYKSIRIFKKKPESNERLNYECKICDPVLVSPFTDKSNLYKNLTYHTEYKKWNEKFKKNKNIRVEPIIFIYLLTKPPHWLIRNTNKIQIFLIKVYS